MSGIIGIIQSPGVSVPVALLEALTADLAFRGPDAQEVWCTANAGLGCALLRTTREAEHEKQPLTLDGVRYLVADTRLDGRAELLHDLATAGCSAAPDAPDAELLLHAFSRWGEECVQRLRGDFAFAVWDTQKRTLFAARDHFGVKPFFYAQLKNGLLFGNTLASLRRHPKVSSQLNEQAVGDFLLFGYPLDVAATTFSDVARLPPAHALTWRDGVLRVRRYWSLPLDGCIRYRRPGDYVEEFRSRFKAAVADRLRIDRAVVFMSGGVDSTAVAATARSLTADGSCDLRALTVVFDRLFPDPERSFAGLAANALKIPVHYLPADDYVPYADSGRSAAELPEPNDDPFPTKSSAEVQWTARHARVALTGDGGDPLLYSSPAYLMGLLQGGRWGTWITECARYTTTRRRLPPLGLRSWLKRRLGWASPPPPFPEWLDESFIQRYNLRERWREFFATPPVLPRTMHAEAHRLLSSPFWPAFFDYHDPGLSGCPLEFRHPFFDVRLVEFVLAIPVLPWCADKELVRTSMRGRLPKAVYTRPKSPLNGDPFVVHLRNGSMRWTDHFDPVPTLAPYVNAGRVRQLIDTFASPDSCWKTLLSRPIALNYWLREQPGARVSSSWS